MKPSNRRTLYFLWTTALFLILAGPAEAKRGDCGQPVSDGAFPAAPDALHVLRASLAMEKCDPRVCDVTADCRVTASDSLSLLNASVGRGGELSCRPSCDDLPCGATLAPTCGGQCPSGSACMPVPDDAPGVPGMGDDDEADSDFDEADSDFDEAEDDGMGLAQQRVRAGRGGGACSCVPDGPLSPSTTMPFDPIPTTTTTTMGLPVDSNTTTTVPFNDPVTTTLVPVSTTLTTTTTMPDLSAGKMLYDNGCWSCHSLGGYDPDGFAGNLSGRGSRLRADMTTITSSHRSIPEPPGPTLSDQELRDLMQFLDAN